MQTSNRTFARIAALIGCLLAVQLGGLVLAREADDTTTQAAVSTSAPTVAGDQEKASRMIAPAGDASTTTTEAPAPTTTVAPAPTTTEAPAAKTHVSAPAPTPAPAPAPAPKPTVSPLDQAKAAFTSAVPAVWRNAIPVRIEVIPGSTSWGWSDGRIQVGLDHVLRGPNVLRATLAHEFGHLIAFRYGSQAFAGAAPKGWPAHSSRPEEAWADCVAHAFTGLAIPSHGLPSCPSASLSWTSTWLAQGPAAHPRT